MKIEILLCILGFMGSALGLFIKEKSVDLVYLKSEGKKYRLINNARVNILPSPHQKRRNSVSDALVKAFKQVSPRTRRLGLCLPSSITRLKRVEVAGAKGAKFKKLAEDKGRMMLASEEAFVTSLYAEKRSPSAVFAAAEREGVEDCLWALKSLKVYPLVVEPVTAPVLRTLRNTKQLSESESALIHYFASDNLVNTTLVKDGGIYLSRNTYLDSSDKSPADTLAMQTEFLFDYFKSQPEKIDIPRIILCGAPGIPEIWTAPLRQKFPVAVNQANLDGAIMNMPAKTPGLCAAIGAAMQAILERPDKINLRPRRSGKLRKEPVIAVLSVVFIVAAAAALFFMVRPSLMKSVEPVSERRLPLEKEKGRIKAIRDTLTENLPINVQFELEGVTWDGAEYTAIINGALYKVGDVIRGYKVIAIDYNSATLTFGPKKVKLTLHKHRDRIKK